MPKKTLFVVVLVGALVAIFYFQMTSQIKRVQQVDVESEEFHTGTVHPILLKNNASKKVEFQLRCYQGRRLETPPTFSQNIKLLQNDTQTVNINPELSEGNLPRMIANKQCVAFWQGPFGIEKPVWSFGWEYSKPAKKRSE